MTFAPQGSNFGPPQFAPTTSAEKKGLPFYLLIAVAALGMINLLIGFARYVGSSSTGPNFYQASAFPIGLLITGGVVAAVSLLPKQSYTGIAAALSVSGFLTLALSAISLGTSDYYGTGIGTGLIFMLIVGFVQAAVAVAALLLESGVITAPIQPSQGYNNQPRGFNQQGQQGGQYGAQPYNPQAQTYGQPTQSFGQPAQQNYGQPAQQNYGQPVYGESPQHEYRGAPGYGSAPSSPSPTDQQSTPGVDPSASYGQQQPGQATGSHYSSDQFTAPRGYGQPIDQSPQHSADPASPAPAPEPNESTTETRAFDARNPNDPSH